jgi:hypothetical protein
MESLDSGLRDLMRELIESYATTPVRSVAVVGNAPMAPSAERADEIDACDVVFRVNSFWVDPAHGPRSHGRKVNVVVFNHRVRCTPTLFDDYRNRAYFITEGGQVGLESARGYPDHWPADLGCWPIPNRAVVADLVDLIDPGGEDRVVPTTGTNAAYLGHLLFPDAELLLTGFSFLEQPLQTSWQHHEGGTVPVPKVHRIDKEGELLQSWLDSGRARLLR